MTNTESEDSDLVRRIAALTDTDVSDFVLRHAADRTLSDKVRRLNEDALSADATRRRDALSAIRKLGFL